MRWESLQEASKLLKINLHTLRSRGAVGHWPRKETRVADTANSNRYTYAVPESSAEAEELGLDKWFSSSPAEDFDIDIDVEEDFEVCEPKSGPYIMLGNDYVFNIPSKPKQPWVVSKQLVKKLVTMYSRDGDDATLNMIARELGWHRRTVLETLRALGKTHDSLPFTDEELAEADEDQLVEDLVRRKEEKVHVRASRIDWKKTKDLADKARRWETFVRETFSQMEVPPPPAMPKWKQDRLRSRGTIFSEENYFTIVSHASDLHFGKSGWVNQIGEEFGREACRDRLFEATQKMIERVSVFGTPQEVILGVGGDWFHIDNHRGTTTRGTPQDHDGSFLRIFQEGCALARDHIEMWRQAVPKVRVVCVRGNHDYLSTAMLVHWLQAKYDGVMDVEVGRSEIDREYLKVGNTILGLTHGDSVKDKDLVSLMACEAKELWSQTKYRLWLTGHWHSQITNEIHGVQIDHLPSLAGTDAWHHQHGYVGNRKALMAHIIDDVDGPIAKVLVDVG